MQLEKVARDKAERMRAVEEACEEPAGSDGTSWESRTGVVIVF